MRLRLLSAMLLFGAVASAQNYYGVFDYGACDSLWGWAWDSTQPNTPISVDLLDGSTLIETVSANVYRADLQNAGYGNGIHGFSYNTPPSLKNGQNHSIHARVSGSEVELGYSPRTINCTAGSTGYQYYYTDALTSINGNNWIQNGSGTAGSSGYTSAGAGNLISSATITNRSIVNYEVRMTLNLTQSGGYYAALLRASDNATLSNNSSGTFYAMEVANPTFVNGSCSAGLNLWKVVSGSVTLVSSTGIPCHSGMIVRAFVIPLGSVSAIYAYVDNANYMGWADLQPLVSGAPGVAVVSAPAGNTISQAQLGPWDSTPPNAISAAALSVSSFPTHVDMQWQGTSDDPNGTGVAFYQIYRSDPAHPTPALIGLSSTPAFGDATVTANTSYTYTLDAVDYHRNVTGTAITAVTPAAGSLDPRQTGVRPTGSYWGGGGENIDMRSGNLNFTIPLLSVKGRGWNVPFNLSYNSQNWRQDSGGTWNLGRDRGFGYGWNLQGGALLPQYSGWFSLDHYLFIDTTGAEYRLDQNNGGIWTSKESIYVEYDSNAGRLYFPDGTFWVFGCTSAGTEEDAGVQYPTVIQDTNGNRITITYAAGQGVTWTNSSSRISSIQDIMGTYTLSYTLGWFPHLTTITSSYPAENYTFRYLPNANLIAPFSGGGQFGSAQVLQTVTNTNSQMATTFSYGSNGADELIQVTFPYAGNLQWAYGNATFTGRTQREVQTRHLTMSSGGTQYSYPITHPGDTGTTFHSTTTLTDAGGVGSKAWTFDTTSTDGGFGLQTQFDSLHSGTSKSRSNATWSLDPLNRPYISSTLATLDPGSGSQVQKQTNQAIDQFGNVTSMTQYDFGVTNPRTYTNTYLSDSSPTSVHPAGSDYNAEHIHNRLLTTTVTQGGTNTTLVSNSYDFYNPSICGSSGTPQGWINIYPAGMLDTSNTNNVFRGNVTTSAGLDMTHTMCYATTGAVVGRSDGGHATTTQTDSTTDYTAPTAITTGSLTTSLGWTSSLGLSNETGPNGDSVGVGYDSANRPSVTTTPFGAYTTYSYSISPAQTTATVTTNDPNTNGRKSVAKYDGLGRTIEVDSIDASGVTRSIVQSQYAPCGCSPLGKLSQQSMPYKPGDTPVWTVYTYDGLGRTLSVRSPDGSSTTTYSYVGNTVTVTDPAGHWKKFTMDGFGNLLNVVEPDSSQTSTGGTAASNYIYDALNHLTQVIMGRQMPGGNTVWQTRTFNYNVGSSITAYLQSATNPENGTVSYIYNNTDGTLFSKTDAKGQTLKYARDSYGRVLTVSLAGSPDTVLRTYTYDTNAVDNTFSQNSQGRVTTVQYAVPSISSTFDNNNNEIDFTGDTVVEMYSYTAPGQVAAKRLRVTRADSLSENLQADINGSWTYNNEGKLNGVTYPVDPNYRDPVTGNPVTPVSYSYSFDGMGRLAGMTESVLPTTLVSGVTYNAAGQMLTGLDTRTYNANGQLTRLVNSSMNTAYNYSATQNNGKITSQVDNLSGETVTYAYDSLNRLLSATASSWNQSFVYDPFGNLTDKNGTLPWHGVPDATTNRLGSTDANGNASGATWDPVNRMTANGTARYAYDAQNKRVWGCTATGPYAWSPCGSEIYFFYGPDGKLMSQFTPVYTLAYRDQQFQQHPATLTFQSGATRAYFGGRLLGDEDRLGSRVGKYYPYGEDRSVPPPGNDQVKFATYTRDSLTGLDYADQRYYAASAGRFMSPDPYMASGGPGDPVSWNRYMYTRGDPINRLDPSGLQDFWGFCWTNPDTEQWQCSVAPTPGRQDLLAVQVTTPLESLYNLLGLFLPKKIFGGTPEQAQKVRDAYEDALMRLLNNPECNDALSNLGLDAAATLEDTTYRVFDLGNPGAGASTNAGFSVFLNSGGAFFNAAPDAQGQVTLTIPSTTASGPVTQVTFLSQTSADAFILLHELGHETGLFGPDSGAGMSAINAQNSWVVLTKCFGINQPGGN